MRWWWSLPWDPTVSVAQVLAGHTHWDAGGVGAMLPWRLGAEGGARPTSRRLEISPVDVCG